MLALQAHRQELKDIELEIARYKTNLQRARKKKASSAVGTAVASALAIIPAEQN